MSTPPVRLPRRAVLAGIGATGAAIALGGCTEHPVRSASEVIAADPLAGLYAETTNLIATYDQAMRDTPGLATLAAPMREEHRQHLVALAAMIGVPAPTISAAPGGGPAGGGPAGGGSSGSPSRPPSGSGGPSPSPSAPPAFDTASARGVLAAAEKTGTLNATTACVAATGPRVAVLASIVASRSAHVAALR